MLARMASRLFSTLNPVIRRPSPWLSGHRSRRSDNTGWWAPPRPPGSGNGGDYTYKVKLGQGGGPYKYDVTVESDLVLIRGTATDSSTFELRHRLPPGVDLSTVKTHLDSQGMVTITAKINNF